MDFPKLSKGELNAGQIELWNELTIGPRGFYTGGPDSKALPELYNAWLQFPEFGQLMLKVADAIRAQPDLSARRREVLVLTTSIQLGCRIEYDFHSVFARHQGLSDAVIAAIGFCFGGSAALELGRSGADLRAIVGFHSGLKTARPEDTAAIQAKLLLCLGDADPLIPGEVRDAFMDNVREAKLDAQMILYSGVGHSFTNPDAERFGVAGCHYDATADRRSWAAMRALFDEVFA